MRLIADQDVYQVTVEFLRSIGHDVLQAKDAGLSSASDLALLEHAHRDHHVTELHRFFSEHRVMDMRGCFVVIEPGRHRIRRTQA